MTLEEKAIQYAEKDCKERNCGHVPPNDWEISNDAFISGYKEAVNDAIEWLQKKLVTDHVDTDHGLGCILPDIIMCEEYFKVDDFIKGFKEAMYNGKHICLL